MARIWLIGASLVVGCSPQYVDTLAPEDAAFEISCAGACGPSGRDQGLIIDVSFSNYGRQYSTCCGDRQALMAQLQTVEDMWCDGLDVPPKTIGEITVATTKSQATGNFGVTLDQGDGYVAFNCGDWLPKLIHQLKATVCCRN